MNFCDDARHKDIAYDGNRRDGCPLCEALETIAELEDQISQLQEESD